MRNSKASCLVIFMLLGVALVGVSADIPDPPNPSCRLYCEVRLEDCVRRAGRKYDDCVRRGQEEFQCWMQRDSAWTDCEFEESYGYPATLRRSPS